MSKSAPQKPSRQPSLADLGRAYDAFDPASLIDICETKDFSQYAERVDLVGNDRFYWYRDNGSDVLAVAHLDSVQDDVHAQVIDTAAGPLVVSGALDDRLGAYVILELLPKLGITCDILLTTDEEIGRSTAAEFYEYGPEKAYNWIIQFDRGGTDVVMYQYETKDLADLVREAGATVGVGSYSDICDLDDLGCAAFNWGVGYADYHSPKSHAWLADTFRMVARFVKFHQANHDTYLPYVWERRHTAAVGGGWDDKADFDFDSTIEADCGHLINVDDPDTYIDWGENCIICARCDAGEWEAK